jgi:hypothetical protein
MELFQAKSGFRRVGFRLLEWAVPPKPLSLPTTASPSKPLSSKKPSPIQREGEFVKKPGANVHDEVWSTSLEKVCGQDKATLRPFERKYLGI